MREKIYYLTKKSAFLWQHSIRRLLSLLLLLGGLSMHGSLQAQELPDNCNEFVLLVSELNANPNTTLYDYADPTQQLFNQCIGPDLGGGEGIAVDPNSKRIYIGNNDNQTVEVWDGTTQQLVDVFPIDGGLLDISLSTDYQTLYVASYSSIHVYDALSATLLNTCDLNAYTQGSGVWGIAESPINGYLYVSYGWRYAGTTGILVINPDNCQVISTIGLSTTAGTYPVGFLGIAMQNDGTFWAVRNNLSGDQDYIIHYSATGEILKQCAVNTNSLWDIAIGPDDNLYVTSYAGAEVIKVDRNTCVNSNYLQISNELSKGLAFGCREVICQVPCPTITISSSQTQPTCESPNGGSSVITASGGVSPYDFIIKKGTTTVASGTANTSYTATNLSAGTYSVYVQDANGCEKK
ncbi:MAG: hypothetical protein IPL35_07020 [Sphingobacteriales bacterium]|nr:hypothetical protein [Sphingobacteriales bacterium]